MADLFPDEGLDALLAITPKGGANPANLFVGLFTASGGTSVPASNATLTGAGTNLQGCAEVSTTQWSTYTRQTVAAGSWSAAGASTIWGTTGRKVDGPQVTFPAPSAPYSPAQSIAGFFLSDTSIPNTGKGWYFSNFADTSLIGSLAIGDLVKVTPTIGFGN